MDQATELRNIVKHNNQGTKKVARVITVTSGKGGVGKSNVAINLAVEFTRLGQKVIIFDADFGLANIEVMFGAIPKHKATVAALGLKKTGRSNILPDNDAVRGMCKQVCHLVKVEEA